MPKRLNNCARQFWFYERDEHGFRVHRSVGDEIWFYPDARGRYDVIECFWSITGHDYDFIDEFVQGACAVVKALTGRRKFGKKFSPTREALCFGIVEALNAYENSCETNTLHSRVDRLTPYGERPQTLAGFGDQIRPQAAGSGKEVFGIGAMPVEPPSLRNAGTGAVGETCASVPATDLHAAASRWVLPSGGAGRSPLPGMGEESPGTHSERS